MVVGFYLPGMQVFICKVKAMASDIKSGGVDLIYQVADFCMQDFLRVVKAMPGDMHLGGADFISRSPLRYVVFDVSASSRSAVATKASSSSEEPTGAARAYRLARMVQAAADDTRLGGEARRQKLTWTPR